MKKTKQLGEWLGDFGKKYTDRNSLSWKEFNKLYRDNYGRTRTELNNEFLDKMDRSIKILEVGSNIGNQLLCLQKMGFTSLYGIEPQEFAAQLCRRRNPAMNIIQGDAFDIPLKDGYFDMVFTSGCLIHINPRDIKRALKEIYRCTNHYIWGFEYYADRYYEIQYRSKTNLLWKADFPGLFTSTFRDLKVVKIQFFKYVENDNVDVMYLLKKND